MRMRMSVKMLAVAALSIVLLMTGTAAVLAQGPDSPDSVPGGPIATFKETFWQILADKVGVEKDDLLEYVKEAARETIRGAIDRGLVPEGLGNQLLRRLDARSTRLFPFVRPRSGPWRRRLPRELASVCPSKPVRIFSMA